MKDFDIKKLRREYCFEEKLAGTKLNFCADIGLFSPKKVDDGSRLLIEKMEINPDDGVLDVGCGYGVLGITAAKLAVNGQVDMVDKDFVAVEYAQRNIGKNGLANARAYLSNMFDQVDEAKKFDVILSNIPAKVTKEMYWLMFYEASRRLKSGGKIYLVAITHLRDFLKTNLKRFFGNYKKLVQAKGYVVYRAEKK